MPDLDEWRSWPKVSPARSGAANRKRYTDKRVEGTEAIECLWCHALATKLCDTTLRTRRPNGDLGYYEATCDAPVCPEHAQVLSVVFISYSGDERGETDGDVDSLDACPYCAGRVTAGAVKGSSQPWRETDYVSAKLWRERVADHGARAKRGRDA